MVPHSIVTAFLLVITGSTAAFADEIIQMTPPEYKAFSDVAREFGNIQNFQPQNGGAAAEVLNDDFKYFVYIPGRNGKACEEKCSVQLSVCNENWKKPDYDDFGDWDNKHFSYITWDKDSGTCLSLDAPNYGQSLTKDKLGSILSVWLKEVDKFKQKFATTN